MKKLSLLLIAFLCPFIISAQEVFQTNFQTETEFQQWLVVDNNADENTWQFDPYAEPSKTFYNYHSTNAADDWFISPVITSAETGTVALSFSVQGSSYVEKIEVFYGNEQTTEAMTNRLSEVISLGNEITHHLYLINVNANEPLYLGFHACSDADKWRLYLCDVNVEVTNNPVDIQAAEFVSPVTDFGLDQETVAVKVKNTGNVDVNSFEITFSVDGNVIATETVDQLLSVGGEMLYTFTATADLSEPRKTFNLKAWTTHADDVNVTNNACETTVLHKAPASVPYAMGFEANEYTDGITFFNLNEDDGTWDLYTDPWWSLAHTGDYCLAYNYDKYNSGHDWVILEPITVSEPGYYVLKFWYSGDDSHPEKLGVYYGNAAAPESMTNKIVEYAPFARGSYEESINIFYIDQPQDIYIGFYAFSDKDENWLCVDDVVFEKIDADDVDMAVLPITDPQQYVHKGSRKDIAFKIRNLGIAETTSTVRVMIDETKVYEEDVTTAGQEIKDIVLSGALKDLAAGKHTVSVELVLDDADTENNNQSLEFQVLENPALAWDFEDGNVPADFSFCVEDNGTVNPSAGAEFNEYGWGIFNIGEHELYGEHLLAGTSWLDGTEKADRWCVLPPFAPTEESYLVWDVASFNPYFLETYYVMISSNGNDTWYYFTEEEYVNESADFKTRGIDLSDYAGQEIYIAFRLRSENCEHLILDNIELYGGTAVELLDVTATVDPEEGVVWKLDEFTVTFENVESVVVDEYSYFYMPYIAIVDENNSLEQIAGVRVAAVEDQPTQLSLYIEEDEMTEITEFGKYALVIPRKYLVFNDDPQLLISAKEFVFYYEVGIPIESPSNLKADSITSSSVTLTWDAVENALSYNVYSADVLLANVTETTYTVVDLTAETEYTFVVSAVRDGQEKKSEAIVVKTLEAEPEPENPGEGIEEFEASFNVYPNPVNDKLYIETEAEVEKVVVYDIYGRQQSTVNGQQSLSIDMSDLNSGVYFVKVVTENGEVVKRIVKN